MDSMPARFARQPWFTSGMTSGALTLRHGLTAWNAEGRWQGWADVALSEEGIRQTKMAAERLAGLFAELDIPRSKVQLVASDLERARHTAEILGSALGLSEIQSVADLRERHIGDWSGKLTAEINETWPGMLDAWRMGQLEATPGGETEDGFRDRVTAALVTLCEQAHTSDQVLLVVTHGGVLRTLDRFFGAPVRPVGNISGRWFSWSGESVAPGDQVDLLGVEDGSVPSGTTGTAL